MCPPQCSPELQPCQAVLVQQLALDNHTTARNCELLHVVVVVVSGARRGHRVEATLCAGNDDDLITAFWRVLLQVGKSYWPPVI